MPEDVFGDDAERHETLFCCRQVAAPVIALSLPARVMCLAVAFDDEPSVDEEVDPPDPGNGHLTLDGAADGAEDEAQQRLRPGLGACIEQPTQPPEATGKRREKLVQIIGVQ